MKPSLIIITSAFDGAESFSQANEIFRHYDFEVTENEKIILKNIIYERIFAAAETSIQHFNIECRAWYMTKIKMNYTKNQINLLVSLLLEKIELVNEKFFQENLYLIYNGFALLGFENFQLASEELSLRSNRCKDFFEDHVKIIISLSHFKR